MMSAVRRVFALTFFLLFALLAVEVPARVLDQGDQFAISPSEVSAIVEPMVRQARQQSTATVTILKTVCIHPSSHPLTIGFICFKTSFLNRPLSRPS